MSVKTTSVWKCDRCCKVVTLESDSNRTHYPCDPGEIDGGRWFTVSLGDLHDYEYPETKHLCSKCTSAYTYFMWGWKVDEIDQSGDDDECA